MPHLIEIGPPIDPQLAVWPGDVPFSREVSLSIERGDPIELSSVRTTLHLGAHADAPSHYAAGGATMEARDPAFYVGPCQVVHVDVGRGERIPPLELPIEAPRVLIRTGTFPDPTVFNRDFASLSVELVEQLAAAGVRLIGIDTPSVDPFDDAELHAHQAIHAHGMAILEGLVLDGVAPGLYTLLALPLRLVGADASPVRPVLLDASIDDPLETT